MKTKYIKLKITTKQYDKLKDSYRKIDEVVKFRVEHIKVNKITSDTVYGEVTK